MWSKLSRDVCCVDAHVGILFEKVRWGKFCWVLPLIALVNFRRKRSSSGVTERWSGQPIKCAVLLACKSSLDNVLFYCPMQDRGQLFSSSILYSLFGKKFCFIACNHFVTTFLLECSVFAGNKSNKAEMLVNMSEKTDEFNFLCRQ